MYQLTILDSRSGQSRKVALSGTAVTVGSSVDSDVVLPGKDIAPHHGRFEADGDLWQFVADEDSPGAELNGQMVRVAQLRVGDVLNVGPFRLVITAAAMRPAASAATHHVGAGAHGGHAHHASYAPAPAAESESGHAPRRHFVSKREMQLAGEGRLHAHRKPATSNEGAKTVGIVIGILVVLVIGYAFFAGNPWGQMSDEVRTDLKGVRQMISTCDFAGASRKIEELLASTEDDSARRKILEEKEALRKAVDLFEKGKAELQTLVATVSAGGNPRDVQDKLRLYAYTYRDYKPLADEANRYWTEINDQLRASMAAPKPKKKEPEPEED